MVMKMMKVTPKCVRIARWLGQNTNQSFGIFSVGILIVDILSDHSPQKACVLPGGWDKIPTNHLLFCPLVFWLLTFCPKTHPKRPVNCQVVGTAGKDVVAAGTSCCWAFLIIIDLCGCEYHGWWKTVNREIVDIGWKDVPGNRNRLGCPLLASTSI